MNSFLKYIFISTIIISLIFILLSNQSTTAQGKQNKNQSLEIYDLRCEGLKNPLGIDVVQPRLSWKMHSSVRGQEQTAYRILVSDNYENLEKEIGNLWDTGKINSDQSIQLLIPESNFIQKNLFTGKFKFGTKTVLHLVGAKYSFGAWDY